MNVTINALHCSIPDSLRTTASQRMERLTRFHPRVADAQVTFDRSGAGPEVEARLAIPGIDPLVARAEAASFDAALDRAADRLERQLKRTRERRVSRALRRRRAAATPELEA